jgi:molybdenum cofactor guanylyltransferase
MTTAKKVKPVLGAVLSGGLSIRMGMPKDRILLPDGKSMISCVIDKLLTVCSEVIVAGPKFPVTLQETDRVRFVMDNYPGQGPLSGIEAVLSTGAARGYLIAACDQPRLTAEILRLLLPENRQQPCFFDFSEDGYINPFPGYYPVCWLPDIRDSLRRNRRAIKALIAETDVILRPVEPQLVRCLKSINTREELAALSREGSQDFSV